ncbi:hypothetical protein HNR06_004669 [Nocardiopsis arvandica]|uniref:Uncharacterized protein n=1 Tax=Nocardiopsis sinuspersici TaxID=501010 RepID=A0A7Z0BMA3_9ACTN|nr:hypothetical protein [Nocardiopsis sinuspersici]NYH55080.1 hypothetical protein [Nocardiopsis sinuspersici]
MTATRTALAVPGGSGTAAPARPRGATVAIDNLCDIGETSVRNPVRPVGGDAADADFVEPVVTDGLIDSAPDLDTFIR